LGADQHNDDDRELATAGVDAAESKDELAREDDAGKGPRSSRINPWITR
jgi:hypothetical protein